MSYSNYGVPIKRSRTEEEYFDDDDDNADYRVTKDKKKKEDKSDDDEEEEDSLDAFMANLEKDAKKQGVKSAVQRVTMSELRRIF